MRRLLKYRNLGLIHPAWAGVVPAPIKNVYRTFMQVRYRSVLCSVRAAYDDHRVVINANCRGMGTITGQVKV